MGFFDKVKETAKNIKEENRNFGTTMKRMNDTNSFFGFVNDPRTEEDGDFRKGSYISIESGKGVIYGAAQDDYFFDKCDIISFKFLGERKQTIKSGNEMHDSMRFLVVFKDGKNAMFDIISTKTDDFKLAFNIVE